MSEHSSAAGQTCTISLELNGERRELQVQPWTTLLDLLRDQLGLAGTKKGCDHGQCGACTVLLDQLGLAGTKKGCDHGQCGACTVLLDGRRINSCLTLAVMHDGARLTTIEGLASTEALHPLQAAFVKHDAFQCGYCTPGQICSAAGLAAEHRASSRDEIREHMSGNLCRCGAYPNILAAIEEALPVLRGQEGAQ